MSQTLNVLKMDAILLAAAAKLRIAGIKGFKPQLSESENWTGWITRIGNFTCEYCYKQNGKVFDTNDIPLSEIPPVHRNCNCYLQTLLAILAGTATVSRNNGADYWIKNYQVLPNYYVDKGTATNAVWRKRKGNLDQVFPGKMIGGDDYHNKEGKLPHASGRKWYEADIMYTGGFRNDYRVLYSNDGLVFVTYDHYTTFMKLFK